MSEPPQDETDFDQEFDEGTSKEEAPRKPGRFARLKGRLQARTIGALDAGIAGLQSLKTRAGAPEEEADESDERRPAPDAAWGEDAPESQPPPKKRRLRKFLLYLLLFVAVGAGGMSLSYRLFSTMLKNQAEKITKQSDQIKRYNVADQHKAEHLAKVLRELDDAQAKVIELKQQLTELTSQSTAPAPKRPARGAAPAPARQARRGPPPPKREPAVAARQPRPERPAATATHGSNKGGALPSAASTFSPAPSNGGNCDLTIGPNSTAELKNCINSYNGQ